MQDDLAVQDLHPLGGWCAALPTAAELPQIPTPPGIHVALCHRRRPDVEAAAAAQRSPACGDGGCVAV